MYHVSLYIIYNCIHLYIGKFTSGVSQWRIADLRRKGGAITRRANGCSVFLSVFLAVFLAGSSVLHCFIGHVYG